MADRDPEACAACLRFYLPRLAANEEGLRQLSLAGRSVDDSAALQLIGALKSNTEVSTLALPNNFLTDGTAAAVAALVEGSATLTRVDLSGNAEITSSGVEKLTLALEANHSATELDCSGTQASDDVLELLQQAAGRNRQPLPVKHGLLKMQAGVLLTLDLSAPAADSRKGYSLESARLVAAALAKDTRLTSLDYSHNCPGDEGVALIADAIGRHPALLELRLDSCGMTDRGAAALTDNLRRNEHLVELRLVDNEVGDAGAQLFVDLVHQNETLAHILLDRNNITPERLSEVVHSLLLNSQPPKLKAMHTKLLANFMELRVVDLSEHGEAAEKTRVNDITCRVLLNCLQHNTTVHTLKLSGNKIGDEGAKLLCVLLKSNTAVRKVLLRGNMITAKGARRFIDVLRHNSVLEEADLSGQRPEEIDAGTLAELAMHLALNREPAALKKLAPLLLESDPSVTAVDLSLFDGVRRPTATTCELLCGMMRLNRVVSELILNGNAQVDTEGVAAVLNLLAGDCCPVRKLGLADMGLGDNEGRMIAELLQRNSVLTEIDLTGNHFTCLREWADVLRTSNHTLQSIRMAEVRDPALAGDQRELDVMLALNAQPRSFKELVLRVYENDTRVTDIDLVEYESGLVTGDNSFRYRRRYDDASVTLLAGALRHNRRVAKLNLSYNKVGDAGALAIADMLRENRSITTMSLASNRITDKGFMAVADALLTNPTLQCLVADENPIKDPMTRKHLNMATSHNAQVAATIYSTVDTTRMTAEIERELDDAVMADALAGCRADRDFKQTMHELGQEVFDGTTGDCFF
eukprot:TRINITY_DN65676_c0_g1_i1.p1 TRINITY_DN65676_c0_g1~~TRINITY_DN65676_c0_g1_i1.p1  ORF type:complete len:833 (+),score=288.03 TRINITY_DN65676_c0_g1_i1:70-2499(+)